MKKFFALLLVLSFAKVQAQQAFEGTIVYRLFENTYQSEKDTAALTVHFGKNKLKITYGRKGMGGIEDVLVHLESGKMYELDLEQKTFLAKRLFATAKVAGIGSRRTIAGHTAIATDLSEKGIAALVASMNRGQVLIWPATDLYYPIPPQYISNIALSMVYDNRIVLGLTIIDRPRNGEASADTLRIEAVSVVPGSLPASHFEIPAGFSPAESVMAPPLQPVEPVEITTGTDPEIVQEIPVPMAPAPKKVPAKTTKKRSTSPKVPARNQPE
ncbi:MAG: hypothetical protein J7578_15615 [Chitinophagaceae bacterium]|nr:hypothetical protein [Chitinophagaceae bacterium]